LVQTDYTEYFRQEDAGMLHALFAQKCSLPFKLRLVFGLNQHTTAASICQQFCTLPLVSTIQFCRFYSSPTPNFLLFPMNTLVSLFSLMTGIDVHLIVAPDQIAYLAGSA
jgi:hypothetical protein